MLKSRMLRKILVEKLNLKILTKLQKVFDPIMSYLKPILDVDQWPIKADSSFGSHASLGLRCTRVSHLAIFCFFIVAEKVSGLFSNRGPSQNTFSFLIQLVLVVFGVLLVACNACLGNKVNNFVEFLLAFQVEVQF